MSTQVALRSPRAVEGQLPVSRRRASPPRRSVTGWGPVRPTRVSIGTKDTVASASEEDEGSEEERLYNH